MKKVTKKITKKTLAAQYVQQEATKARLGLDATPVRMNILKVVAIPAKTLGA